MKSFSKTSKEDKKLKKEQQSKDRVDFLTKKKEMQRLLNEARATYAEGLQKNKISNKNEIKQLKINLINDLAKINKDYLDKKISLEERNNLNNEKNKSFVDAIDFQKSMILNRKLAVTSEYKITLVKIEKTYMNDVIRRSFSYHFKRWFFGLNKEFSRTTWWSKKNVLLDFIVIIVIVGILALIFFGIDMAYLKA